MIYDIIARTMAALLIALLMPFILMVFLLVATVAMVRTLFEPRDKDPDFWDEK
jgi:hypothetical protein